MCNNHMIDEQYMEKLTFKGKWENLTQEYVKAKTDRQFL